MTKYKVVRRFRDLEDNNHIYNIDDKYPRKGRSKKERIDELLTHENKIGVPLITEIEGDE